MILMIELIFYDNINHYNHTNQKNHSSDKMKTMSEP